MNLPTRESSFTVEVAPNSGALYADATLWCHGMHTFLRELDALVTSGRIDPDAHNVILRALKRASPMMDRAEEDEP